MGKIKGVKKKIFSNREKHQILSEVNIGAPIASIVKSNLKLEKGSTHTIQRVLKNSGHLKFTKRNIKPHLKTNHDNDRLKCAEDQITWETNLTKWKTVIFYDEKKFNLD